MNEERLRQGRILLVDDEISSLCLLENVLSRLGFKRLRALDDSTRILEEYEEWQPDLVITDLEMPNVNGLQLVEMLRAHVSRDTCLPVLVLTGAANSRAKRSALVAGATDIIFKPFDSSELQMRIRNLLQTRFQHLEIQKQNRGLEQIVSERTAELHSALAELKTSQRHIVQQERFRAFGEMAGGVVHDFNNALMAIIGYSDILLRDRTLLDERELLVHYLETMNTAGRDASHVVSRLRDFYRPREETDVFTALDVNQLLEEVVPLTRPKWHDQALESGRAVRLALELERVPPILGNGAELREVITNLIFNAVDAMPRGGTITLRSRETRGGVQIEVSDEGNGMTEEVRQRCLEPFFSTKGEAGTGLGLAMAFGIVRRHEGEMEIETAPGCGSTFRLWLRAHHAVAIEAADARLTLSCSLRVLVVDDEPSPRDVVAQYLLSDGHKVTTAVNGEEAMRSFIAEDFDLVITDHGMPGMNGLQLAEAMRRVRAGQPVILITGFASGPAEQPHAVDCVLKKPIALAELRGALEQVQRA